MERLGKMQEVSRGYKHQVEQLKQALLEIERVTNQVEVASICRRALQPIK